MLETVDGGPPLRVEPQRPSDAEAFAAEPLCDEIIVDRRDFARFLARPLVPGAQALPYRIAFSPDDVAELDRFGAATLTLSGGRRLDVVIAGAPTALLREGGAQIQHLWTVGGAAAIDPFAGRISGDKDDTATASWSGAGLQAPVAAIASLWRFRPPPATPTRRWENFDIALREALGVERALVAGIDGVAPAPAAPVASARPAIAEFAEAVALSLGATAVAVKSGTHVCALAPIPPGGTATFLALTAAERLEALDRQCGLAGLRTAVVFGVCRDSAVVDFRREAWPADIQRLSWDWPAAESADIEHGNRLAEAGG